MRGLLIEKKAINKKDIDNFFSLTQTLFIRTNPCLEEQKPKNMRLISIADKKEKKKKKSRRRKI